VLVVEGGASHDEGVARRQFLKLGAALAATGLAGCRQQETAPGPAVQVQPVELRLIAQKHPALDLAFERLQVWAQRTGKARIVLAPISYEVYVEKMSSELLLDRPNAEIIWHNDDWDQLWGPYLEPLDEIDKVVRAKADPNMYSPFWIWEGKLTGMPWVQTLQSMFIRKDLIPEDEVVDWTWADMVERLRKLQRDGKVRWGFVGGMKYPHTWFTWLWSSWANNADIYLPKFERDNKVLAANGWKSGLREREWRETAEFWWDAVYTHKISPEGMPGYTRTDADAIFMAGEAAMTNQDTTLLGDYTDRNKSKIYDRVGFAGFPVGPSGDKRIGTQAPWGWAIPKNADPKKKEVAKEALLWLFTDEESQTLIWTKTGGFPANNDVVRRLEGSDPLFRKVKSVTIGAPKLVLPAYYFAKWPEAHSTLSDGLGRVMTGRREDIPRILAEVLSIYAYKKAFTNLQFDVGTATGILGAAVSMLMGLLFYRAVQRAITYRFGEE
jgi:ABC-type glycerol-3-phosphate transport system substrate-binding protein